MCLSKIYKILIKLCESLHKFIIKKNLIKKSEVLLALRTLLPKTNTKVITTMILNLQKIFTNQN